MELSAQTGSNSNMPHYTRRWKNRLWLPELALMLLLSGQPTVLPLQRGQVARGSTRKHSI